MKQPPTNKHNTRVWEKEGLLILQEKHKRRETFLYEKLPSFVLEDVSLRDSVFIREGWVLSPRRRREA